MANTKDIPTITMFILEGWYSGILKPMNSLKLFWAADLFLQEPEVVLLVMVPSWRQIELLKNLLVLASRHKYVSFYVIRYYIKLERQMKLNMNTYKKITHIFILIGFYIKLYIGLVLICLKIKQ